MSKQVSGNKKALLKMSLQGSKNCIGIGRGVIKALGLPTHVSLKISDAHDFISVFSCDEDDIMAFRVPAKLFSDHGCAMRIFSKRFVQGIMQTNELDSSKTYIFDGAYFEGKNAAVFSLTGGSMFPRYKNSEDNGVDVNSNPGSLEFQMQNGADIDSIDR